MDGMLTSFILQPNIARAFAASFHPFQQSLDNVSL